MNIIDDPQLHREEMAARKRPHVFYMTIDNDEELNIFNKLNTSREVGDKIALGVDLYHNNGEVDIDQITYLNKYITQEFMELEDYDVYESVIKDLFEYDNYSDEEDDKEDY